DLVFADPPYDFSDYETLLAAAEARLGEGGEIALERRWRPAVTQTADGLETVIHRRYGDSGLTVLRRV
ncbi:MAG: RsmD family RNA methyltransferase, partial [Thermoanaerobaculia bacterium]